MVQRRSFLKNSSILAGSICFGSSLDAIASAGKSLGIASDNSKLSILHTAGLSGTFSPVAGPFGGLKKVNKLFLRSDSRSLFLDSGNFLPSGGQQEDHLEVIRLMNKMGYQVTTIGRNELIMGQEQLAAILPAINFKLVNCNYNFSHPALSASIKPYLILNSGKTKIGITGVGNCLNIPGVKVNEPFQAVNEIAKKLKKELACDLVICLSQFSHNTRKYNDQQLAKNSKHIDVIIGGENGKVTNKAYVFKNAKKYDVFVSQAGAEGRTVGELNYEFNQLNTITSLKHAYKISGMPQYASMKEKHEVFNILTTTV